MERGLRKQERPIREHAPTMTTRSAACLLSLLWGGPCVCVSICFLATCHSRSISVQRQWSGRSENAPSLSDTNVEYRDQYGCYAACRSASSQCTHYINRYYRAFPAGPAKWSQRGAPQSTNPWPLRICNVSSVLSGRSICRQRVRRHLPHHLGCQPQQHDASC